jgi:hypothetical protein
MLIFKTSELSKKGNYRNEKYTAIGRAFTPKLQSPKAMNNIMLRQVF